MTDDITTMGKTSEVQIDFTVSYKQVSYMPSHLYVCLNDDCDVILISKPVCKCGNTEMRLGPWDWSECILGGSSRRQQRDNTSE